MILTSRNWLMEHFGSLGISEFYAELITIFILLTTTLIVGYVIGKLVRLILLKGFNTIVEKSKTDWDDMLVQNKVFSAVAHLVPILFIFYALPPIFGHHETLVDYTQRIGEVVIIIACIVIIFRFLNTVQTIVGRLDSFKDKPIASYFQLAKITIGIILGILMLAIIFNKSVIYFFSAFGAMTAVVILVFRDTILGFIASIQLAANDMIRVGDWVQMDKYGADGDVIDINLTTVKVRNWDKTISTVPTYSFISDSFKNWRGMEETGARRISRSLYINQNTIKFMDEGLLNRLKKIHLLTNYLESKAKDVKEYNDSNKIDTSEVTNGRRLTNLGTFRAYLQSYIVNHPQINQDLTVLVRLLHPSEKGVPIQIYAFVNDTAWVNYEAVQGDIFDHAMAVVNQFDLELFQSPSGTDFKKALS